MKWGVKMFRYKEEHYPVIKAMLEMQKFYSEKYGYKIRTTNKYEDGFSKHSYIRYQNMTSSGIEFRFRFGHPGLDIYFPNNSGLVSLEYSIDGKFKESQICGELGVERFMDLKNELEKRIEMILNL